jgi:hypothetical protein
MTTEVLEKRSWELFGEWVKENPEFPYGTDDMIAFASFILEKILHGSIPSILRRHRQALPQNNMKGILKNTKAGWFVLYQVMRDEITSGYDSIPLHPDSQTWMDGYHLYEGKEVQFEIVMDKPDHTYSQTHYAKTIDEDALGCSYPDCICQGDGITWCKQPISAHNQGYADGYRDNGNSQ